MAPESKIFIGDSRRMEELSDGSAHLVVTSPPYWQLKDYGTQDQIGYNDTYEEYINNLNLVWNECARVLVPGCRLCVNIGDQFARTEYYGRYKVIPIRTEIIKFCESAGFDYMGAVIWRKVTTTNTSGGASVMGSFPYPRNGILKIDYEFILIFRKYGESPKVPLDDKLGSKMSLKEWNEYFSGHWSFPGARQEEHLAAFPEELPRRLIRMFTFEGETVLDPFLGSGVTCLAAGKLGRNSIGYEINSAFLPVIRKKLGIDQKSLFSEDNISVEIFEKKKEKTDWAAEIEKLPFVFRDPVKISRKEEKKKKRFGSKVDGSEEDIEKYFSVSRVTGPLEVELNGGRVVRLHGLKEIAGNEEEASGFIVEMTKGEKVYLRTDAGAAGSDDSDVYLYLKNRTFINAHLVKKGLADVDTGTDFRFRERFVKYAAAWEKKREKETK